MEQGSIKREQALRGLPSVERLSSLIEGVPRAVAVAAAREEIDRARREILDGHEPASGDLAASASALARRRAAGMLGRVINATGVVIHTNLGRSPLAPAAAEAAARVASAYSNLEYDLDRGERSSRQEHVAGLLGDLTGSDAAIAVNNNAAAVLLALAASAAGGEVIVSRGELVEIGGSFRIPEIMEFSGARLVEVGTTNRTRIGDYEGAVTDQTAALLRVHQSNFRTVGFVERAELEELCELARSRELILIDDLGSGALEAIADEPRVADAVGAGADLVCFSADKLLGGPQAGILCGTVAAVGSCRTHPLARALRLDKLQLAALEATLRLHRDCGSEAIPALAMLHAKDEELQARADLIATTVGAPARVGIGSSRPGGGSLPLQELAGPVCEIDPGEVGADLLCERLRLSEPPVIARISEGAVILDPRTMSDEEARAAAEATGRALG